jgi:hypothetical protein
VGALSFFHLGSLAHAESSGSSELGAQPSGSPGDAATRPFHISFPETDLVDLRRRIAETRWPDKEAIADASQGVQLETVQKLAQYWATDYDSRRVDARLNALTQFVTNIEGLDIHFIQVRSMDAAILLMGYVGDGPADGPYPGMYEHWPARLACKSWGLHAQLKRRAFVKENAP